jgi:hypothetical protein
MMIPAEATQIVLVDVAARISNVEVGKQPPAAGLSRITGLAIERTDYKTEFGHGAAMSRTGSLVLDALAGTRLPDDLTVDDLEMLVLRLKAEHQFLDGRSLFRRDAGRHG